MGKIVRYCISQEDLFGENVFDVSRRSILGNPFTHIKNGKHKAQVVVKDRDTAINMYEKYMYKAYDECEDYRKAIDRLYEAYKKYDVIYLGCYCKLNERCHADIIEKYLVQRAIKEFKPEPTIISEIAEKTTEQVQTVTCDVNDVEQLFII